MSESSIQIPYKQLILWPAIITLAVTLVRLAGELLHGPRLLFNPDVGGGFALVGIAWLAPAFGIYFARRLACRGLRPRSNSIAVQTAILGIMVVIVVALGAARVDITSPFLKAALMLWLPVAAGAALQYSAWPALTRTLFVYALTARIPVAFLMFFAMLGQWGTHYDAIPQGFPEVGLGFKYLWLALLPQMVFWVGYTVLVGTLFGSIATALRKSKPYPPNESL